MTILPSRTCALCHEPITVCEAPTYDGKDYCSADCAIDASQGIPPRVEPDE